MESLAKFRVLMALERLEPEHVTAAIVYLEEANPTDPLFLLLEETGKSEDEIKAEVFEALSRADVLALGMIFRQYDPEKGKQFTFPYQFTGLSPQAIQIMREAVRIQETKTHLTKVVN